MVIHTPPKQKGTVMEHIEAVELCVKNPTWERIDSEVLSAKDRLQSILDKYCLEMLLLVDIKRPMKGFKQGLKKLHKNLIE